MGALSKESFVYANSVTPGNVINSNACITPSNLINSLNSGGRSSSANSIKRKLDDTDNKSEVKKVSPKVQIMKITPNWIKKLFQRYKNLQMRMLVNLFSQAKLETKALKAKRPGFTDERYNETSYYHEPENSKMDLFSQIIYHPSYQNIFFYYKNVQNIYL